MKSDLYKRYFRFCWMIVWLAIGVASTFFILCSFVLWLNVRNVSKSYFRQVSRDIEDYLDQKKDLLRFLSRLWDGQEIENEWVMRKAVLVLSLMDPMIEDVGLKIGDRGWILSCPYQDMSFPDELFLANSPVFWENAKDRGIWLTYQEGDIISFLKLNDVALWSVFLPMLDRDEPVAFSVYDPFDKCVLSSDKVIGKNGMFVLSGEIGNTGWILVMSYAKAVMSGLAPVGYGSIFLAVIFILICCIAFKSVRKMENAVDELSQWIVKLRDGECGEEIPSNGVLSKELPCVANFILDLLKKIKDYEERSSIWAVGRTIRWISHEVKNRLVPIKSFIQVAMSQKRVSPSVKKLAVLALGQLSQCEKVISELSALRPDVPINIEEVDVCSMLYEIAESFQTLVFDKKVDLEIFCDKGIIFPLDKEKVMMALSNLILNSVEAVGKNGRIKLFAYRMNYGLILEVEDDGCGIPEEIKDRLFEPFVSTKGGQTDNTNYRGIGLAIVYNVVTAHGGRVSVESVRGRTSFKLWFPLNKIDKD